MTPDEIDRLACAIHALRPDWPATSLRTFIRDRLAHKPHLDAVVALAWVAADPTSQTPARVLAEQGPWWRATTSTTTAPQSISTRSADTCRICHRDADACRRAAAATGDDHPYTPRRTA